MTFLISFALAALLIAVGRDTLKKHPIPFYLGAAVLAVAVILCTVTGAVAAFPLWFRTWVWPIFSKASFSTALFVVVMYTGALPNGSPLMKRLMPIRGELSIVASILTLGHNLSYGRTYFRFLFTQPDRLPPNQIAAAILSLLMMCIMIPLWITSFPAVRKKMKARNWKRLQRLAYAFYAMIYCHVMLLTVPSLLQGNRTAQLTVLVYSVVFLSYAVCRIQKAALIHGKKSGKVTEKRQLSTLAIVAVVAVIATFGAGRYGAAAVTANAVGTPPAETAPVETASPAPESSPVESVLPTEPEPPVETQAPAETTAPVESEPPAPESSAPSSAAPESPSAQPSAALASPVPSPVETAAVPAPTTAPEPSPEPEPTPEPEPASKYKDGTYSGSGQGYEGMISVSVTISGDQITNITVTSAMDDSPYIDDAKAGVIPAILSAQSADVNAVSGATFSSKGIMAAVKSALSSARN